ncbi:MAG: hypothetical protein EBR82_54310 [Caulobacteraceae bacterium]|nr:hypothetical protein [Caulobacteraceae bacterium]
MSELLELVYLGFRYGIIGLISIVTIIVFGAIIQILVSMFLVSPMVVINALRDALNKKPEPPKFDSGDWRDK